MMRSKKVCPNNPSKKPAGEFSICWCKIAEEMNIYLNKKLRSLYDVKIYNYIYIYRLFGSWSKKHQMFNVSNPPKPEIPPFNNAPPEPLTQAPHLSGSMSDLRLSSAIAGFFGRTFSASTIPEKSTAGPHQKMEVWFR